MSGIVCTLKYFNALLCCIGTAAGNVFGMDNVAASLPSYKQYKLFLASQVQYAMVYSYSINGKTRIFLFH